MGGALHATGYWSTSWPRSFSLMIQQPATQADRRALTQRGKIEERRQDETVSVEFPDADDVQTGAGERDTGE